MFLGKVKYQALYKKIIFALGFFSIPWLISQTFPLYAEIAKKNCSSPLIFPYENKTAKSHQVAEVFVYFSCILKVSICLFFYRESKIENCMEKITSILCKRKL